MRAYFEVQSEFGVFAGHVSDAVLFESILAAVAVPATVDEAPDSNTISYLVFRYTIADSFNDSDYFMTRHHGVDGTDRPFCTALMNVTVTNSVVVDFDENVVLARRSAQDLMLLEPRCCVVACE